MAHTEQIVIQRHPLLQSFGLENLLQHRNKLVVQEIKVAVLEDTERFVQVPAEFKIQSAELVELFSVDPLSYRVFVFFADVHETVKREDYEADLHDRKMFCRGL